MADLLENPLELVGVEFVEFASRTRGTIERLFEVLGFARIAEHRAMDAALYRQGGINFIANNERDYADACFVTGDGPYVCSVGLRVGNATEAHFRALELGAAPMDAETAPVRLRVPALQGIGGIPLYLFDDSENADSFYGDLAFMSGADRDPAGLGLKSIDHVAHDVYGGGLSYWALLYKGLFGSRILRCEDIRSAGSCPAQAAAEGIRHIALRTGDVAAAVRGLRAAGVELADMAHPGERFDSVEADSDACLLLRSSCIAETGPAAAGFIQHSGEVMVRPAGLSEAVYALA